MILEKINFYFAWFKRHKITVGVLCITMMSLQSGYAAPQKETPSLIQRSIIVLQDLFKQSEKKALLEKQKADPNDPQNDPRLKHYFGSVFETAPVEAIVKLGGTTLKVQANELWMGSLKKNKINGELKGNIYSLLTYPEFQGKTEENFKDYYSTYPTTKRKNIWLTGIIEPTCGAYNFSEKFSLIQKPLSELSPKKQKSLINTLDCDGHRNFNVTYEVYGDKSYRYEDQKMEPKGYSWKQAKNYPELSKFYYQDGLVLEGFKHYGSGKENETPVTIRKYVYRYFPNLKDKENFEFLVCHVDHEHDLLKEKFPKIHFADIGHAHCAHYLLWNRLLVMFRYSEKQRKQHWKKIRDGMIRFLNSRFVTMDDFVPRFYKKDETGKLVPISKQEIQQFKQTLNP